MKLLIVMSLMMFSFSSLAEITEVVRWKPKDKVSHEQVVSAVKQLKSVSKGVKGLVSKKTYYDSATKTWIDIVVWQDRASADAFETSKAKIPELEAIGDIIDFDSAVTSNYTEIE